MAAQANLTIKKNDGTTDVVWSAITPSGGQTSPAVWKSATVGTADFHRPELRLSASTSKDGKSTKMRGTIMYPHILTDSTTGETMTAAVCRGWIDFDMPRSVPDSLLNEFVSQFVNLGVAIKEHVKGRSAPT